MFGTLFPFWEIITYKLLTSVMECIILGVLIHIVHLIRLTGEGEYASMISLNYRDSRPIYEQIKDGLRKLVVTGAVRQDEKLPSVRELAASLAINPNTIQRAYRELENEGYIYTVSGKGTFAAPAQEHGGARREELLRRFDEAAAELLYMGFTREQLKERIGLPENKKGDS